MSAEAESPSVEEVVEESVAVAGIPSFVESGPAERERTDLRGHVLMVDYDYADPVELEREARKVPGIGVILESSPGSFHFVNLSVREREDMILRALKLHGDSHHTAVAARRGFAVLRVSPKWEVSSDMETEDAPEPTVVKAWVSEDSEGEIPPQSRPHAEWLLRLTEDGSLVEEDAFEWVEGHVPLVAYQTVTGDMKARLWGE